MRMGQGSNSAPLFWAKGLCSSPSACDRKQDAPRSAVDGRTGRAMNGPCAARGDAHGRPSREARGGEVVVKVVLQAGGVGGKGRLLHRRPPRVDLDTAVDLKGSKRGNHKGTAHRHDQQQVCGGRTNAARAHT